MKKPICSRCKRPLSDPVSVAIGMGPECRGALSRKGWKFPKARWKVRGGRSYFMGVTGVVEPPVGNLPPYGSPKNKERVFRGGRKENDKAKEQA